jgi:hypothetical protein
MTRIARGSMPSSRETAETFLRERLAGGPVLQREVKADAEGAGLAWATVRRAKDRLGVVAQRESHGRDGAGRWTWAMSIPARCSTPEVSTLQESEHLAEPNGGAVAAEKTPAAPDLSTPNDPHRCAYCGGGATPDNLLQHGRWRPRKPEGDWVHAGCRSPWQAGGWRRRRNP